MVDVLKVIVVILTLVGFVLLIWLAWKVAILLLGAYILIGVASSAMKG